MILVEADIVRRTLPALKAAAGWPPRLKPNSDPWFDWLKPGGLSYWVVEIDGKAPANLPIRGPAERFYHWQEGEQHHFLLGFPVEGGRGALQGRGLRPFQRQENHYPANRNGLRNFADAYPDLLGR